MKRLFCLVLTLAMLFTLAACSSGDSGNSSQGGSTDSGSTDTGSAGSDDTVYTLRWATTESEATIRYLELEKPIMDLITERSGGRIQFEVYFSSTLAGSGAVIQGMQDGICDAGSDNINSYPGVFKYLELMCTPGFDLGDTFDEKYHNMADYFETYGMQESYDQGIYPLFTAPALDVVLMSNFEINSTADYSGKTISCNSNHGRMFSDYGAAITWVIPPENYEAFHLNIIDGSVNGAGPLSAFNLYEVLDYAYYIPFSTVISSYYISLGAYNEFPDDLKAVLDELQFSQEFLDINNSYVEAMMTDVETACTSGNENFQFLDLPADVADAMMSSCSAEIDSKVAELNEAGLDGDGALALLQSYAADAAE